MALNSTTSLPFFSAATFESPSNNTITPSFPQLVNATFVIEVIRCVHELYVFKNFVFYLTKYLDFESDRAIKFFDDFWNTFPTVPTIVINHDGQPLPMDGFISTPALCIVLTTAHDDPVMQLAADSLKGVRILKTVFVVFPIISTDVFDESFEQFNRFWEIIRTTYDWIWKEQFLNTMMLTIQNNIFILDPYPKPTIINKTDQWQVEDFFVDNSKDLKGYLIDTPIKYDLPRVFGKKFVKIGNEDKLLVSGTAGKFFNAFVEAINATLNDTSKSTSEIEAFDIKQVLTLVATKTIDVSIHSFTALISSIQASQSYPIGINDWCIMVPYRNRSPEHLYLQRIFQNSTWVLIYFSVVYISVVIWLCAPTRPRQFSYAFMQAICSIICIVPTTIFRTANIRMRCLFFALWVLGFILTNWFTCKVTSYLITTLQQQQINTINDVIAANLRIKVFDYEYEKLEAMPNEYPKRFLQQLDIVDKSFMDNHRDHMNTSFGYSVQTDRWRFLTIQQRYLRKPLFQLSQICMGPFYHVFPLYADSHLQMPFKYFIMYANQYGFFLNWEESSFRDALRLKYVQILTVHEELPPLSLRFFRPIWLVWWFGLILSGIVFIFEMKNVYFKKLKERLYNNFFKIPRKS